MAKKEEQKNSLSRNVLTKLWSLRKQMNGIYKDTYSTDPTTKDELDRIGSDIEDHVSKILSRNSNGNIADISRLYSITNLRTAVNSKEYNTAIIDFFENRTITDSLINSYTENKWIIELDREYDVICKYMPKMLEALNTIKDSVLTADNFDKEYLSFNSPNIGPDDIASFNEELESIKKQYELYDKAEKWYDNTSKYGEQFVYKVPYKKALSILLNRRGDTRYSGISGLGGLREVSLITEGALPPEFNNDKELQDSFLSAGQSIKDRGVKNITLEIVKDSALDSVINESTTMRKMISIAEQCSVQEASMSDKVIDSEIFEVPKKRSKKNSDIQSQEGILGKERITPEQLKVPGLLLKELKHENIIMLYMDDICLGYYYLEFLDKQGGSIYQDSLFMRKSITSVGYSAGVKFEDEQIQTAATDELLRYLSYAIVSNLDDKFINDNPYLRKEVYAVLKHNDMFNAGGVDRVRVTYLSPNDVEHITFNEDPDTHRGISDIMAGLIPAKMWCCLYIANVIGILTRGQDTRVYYVKQNVEQNIAQTLLNVINQIKKQNFNIMQIENMNSILGITGKYNDYIIPIGQNGDAPIQMEVMEGQNIDPQTELMDKLEETAINATGVPIELVTARLSLDFSTQLTMSNTKFLRFVLKRQSKFERHLSNIVTDIYNTEYREDTNNKIFVRCVLPAPIMLNMNNLNQVLDLLNQQATTLSEIEYPNNNEEDVDTKRSIFKKNYIHFKLGNYIKQNELDMIKSRTDIEYQKEKSSQEQN